MCGGDHRQLLRQSLELFVLKRASADAEEGDKEKEMAIESRKIVKTTRKGFLGQNELAESLHALTFFCRLPNTLNFHCEPRSRWNTNSSTDIETVQGKHVSTHRVGWLGAGLVESASWLCSLGS